MIDQFKDLWQSLGANQKISLILAGGVVALAMIGMMLWAAQPDYQLLYKDLSAEDTGKIVEKLEQEGVKFEIGRGGTSLYVEANRLDRLRAAARDLSFSTKAGLASATLCSARIS